MFEINQEKCRKAADCVEACPVTAIETKDDGTLRIGDECTDCGACEPACDNKAIEHVQ